MKTPHDIEAEIYFLTPAEGGRNSPVLDDYRPQFYYDGHDWDARHLYPDVKQVNPGDTVKANLGFLSPAEHVGKVNANTTLLDFTNLKSLQIVRNGKAQHVALQGSADARP